MKKIELMKLIKENRVVIKNLMLCDSRMKIVEWVGKNEPVESADLVSKNKCSTQNASTTLSALYKMGWLTREERLHPSGGLMYLYSATKL